MHVSLFGPCLNLFEPFQLGFWLVNCRSNLVKLRAPRLHKEVRGILWRNKRLDDQLLKTTHHRGKHLQGHSDIIGINKIFCLTNQRKRNCIYIDGELDCRGYYQRAATGSWSASIQAHGCQSLSGQCKKRCGACIREVR